MSEKEITICAECGGCNTEESMMEHTFPYGSVRLTATIPIHTCKDCGFQFYNYKAEDIMDQAIKIYLNSKG